MGMAKHDLITKDFALYVVHYFASMLTWSKKDILAEIDRTIKEAKPADAVEVVRCKDCKWCRYSKVHDVQWCDHESGLCDAIVGNDFCSYGERRTDE